MSDKTFAAPGFSREEESHRAPGGGRVVRILKRNLDLDQLNFADAFKSFMWDFVEPMKQQFEEVDIEYHTSDALSFLTDGATYYKHAEGWNDDPTEQGSTQVTFSQEEATSFETTVEDATGRSAAETSRVFFVPPDKPKGLYFKFGMTHWSTSTEAKTSSKTTSSVKSLAISHTIEKPPCANWTAVLQVQMATMDLSLKTNATRWYQEPVKNGVMDPDNNNWYKIQHSLDVTVSGTVFLRSSLVTNYTQVTTGACDTFYDDNIFYPSPTSLPYSTLAPIPSPVSTTMPTPAPTPSPTPSPSPSLVLERTSDSDAPSLSPTSDPTTLSPTAVLTQSPTDVSSEQPSKDPSTVPSTSQSPSQEPSVSLEPSNEPSTSWVPSEKPSLSEKPSNEPSANQTASPSARPSLSLLPSQEPSTSVEPSEMPSTSIEPSPYPSLSPQPSEKPSMSVAPSAHPSLSIMPSQKPSTSIEPSNTPSTSVKPSETPSTSVKPSPYPSLSPQPSEEPSTSVAPSTRPSLSLLPSQEPSTSTEPSATPTPACDTATTISGRASLAAAIEASSTDPSIRTTICLHKDTILDFDAPLPAVPSIGLNLTNKFFDVYCVGYNGTNKCTLDRSNSSGRFFFGSEPLDVTFHGIEFENGRRFRNDNLGMQEDSVSGGAFFIFGAPSGFDAIRSSDVTFIDCQFTNNTSELYGGAVAVLAESVNDWTVTFSQCDFRSNSASSYGGGLSAQASGSGTIALTITQSQFVDNVAYDVPESGDIDSYDTDFSCSSTSVNHEYVVDTSDEPTGESCTPPLPSSFSSTP